ncbi:hypothetical protein FFI94_014890 [Rhodococcus sp. KBS0724]|uniref:hypothetical protein n=1 Tax=Rhodococcus sp. KBS0724 TaxID=1179674 RepID=UPI00110DE459|nr:hypothetical protein [Rhodococcus sp. KBS0724]TSD47317.1 hypothetical protein FFI94_014890 [Rhodococcus sp. KBS0724]
MGNRANIVVIDDEVELYYSHWAANTLRFDLAWGPEHGLRFARSQSACDASDPESWLDTTWCEGVALIDVGRKVLAIGDSEAGLERRLLHQLHQRTWNGWKVVWAPDSLCSIYDYLDIDRGRAHSWEESGVAASGSEPLSERQRYARFWDEDQGKRGGILLSTRNAGSVRMWTTNGHIEDEFLIGPEIFAGYEPDPVVPVIIDNEDPTGGIHIDFDAATISMWNSGITETDIHYLAPQIWPGFTLVRWYDRFEAHNKALGFEIVAPLVNKRRIRETFARIAAQNLPENWINPGESIAGILARQGTPVVLTSAVAEHQPVAPDGDSRHALSAVLAILDDILEASDVMPGPVPVIDRTGQLTV